MKKTRRSIRAAWSDLEPPKEGQGHRAIMVRGSNAWVLRDENGRFGLLIHGVEQPIGAPRLRNIDIRYRPTIEVHSGIEVSELHRCVEVLLEPHCNEETVIRILDRLSEDYPEGTFTTENLIGIINDVIEAFQRVPPPPPYEEIVGVWGELFLLYLLCRQVDFRNKVELIRCWESRGRERDIVDFRFPSAATVVEVKTSVGLRRHHIHGLGQVTIPGSYSVGYLASMRIIETDNGGWSCLDLLEALRADVDDDVLVVDDFDRTLADKIAQRGPACQDSRHKFRQASGGLRLIDMRQVPRPILAPGISEVSWQVDLESAEWMAEGEFEALIKRLSKHRGA
jgi:hypothetical protein